MEGYCEGKNYKEVGDSIVKKLCGGEYKGKVGENGKFMVMD